jgi:putative oxidoreductase
MKRNERIVTLISIAFIFLFVYAALSKWLSFTQFVDQLDNQPFSKTFSKILTYLLPSSELLIAGLLFFDRSRGLGLWASFVLMIVFTGYIILIKLNFYGHIPCSCGGVIERLTWTQHLYFNVVFIALAVWGLFHFYKGQYDIPNTNKLYA